jgi:hypothetical protein
MGILNTSWYRIPTMSYYIKRPSAIDSSKTVYYKGNYHWTENFDDRKKYTTKTKAVAETEPPVNASNPFDEAEVVKA